MSGGDALADTLGLVHHPEGGRFLETLRTSTQVQVLTNPESFDGSRQALTSIYYYLDKGNYISWHVLMGHEVFYYHAGSPMYIYLVDPKEGTLTKHVLGDPRETPGAQFQVVVTPHALYAAELSDPDAWTFFGAAVVPGWEAKDWHAQNRDDLLSRFPQHSDIIKRLTK